MTNKHPYADILQYLIDGGDAYDIECKLKKSILWHIATTDHIANLVYGDGHYEFRIKPKTVMFNGLELPMYETTAPQKGTRYYVASHASTEFVFSLTWDNHSVDHEKLRRGLVFLKEEDATAWGKAMCPRSS